MTKLVLAGAMMFSVIVIAPTVCDAGGDEEAAEYARTHNLNIVISYSQCMTKIDGYVVIWDPNKKLPFNDVAGTTCWQATAKIDQETVDYYALIGASLDVKK